MSLRNSVSNYHRMGIYRSMDLEELFDIIYQNQGNEFLGLSTVFDRLSSSNKKQISKRIIQILTEHPEYKDKQLFGSEIRPGTNLIKVAAYYLKNVKLLRFLLENIYTQPEAYQYINEVSSPFIFSALAGVDDPEMLRLLLQHGGNPNIKSFALTHNGDSKPLLCVLVIHPNRIQLLDTLLEYSMVPLDLTMTDNQGRTVFDYINMLRHISQAQKTELIRKLNTVVSSGQVPIPIGQYTGLPAFAGEIDERDVEFVDFPRDYTTLRNPLSEMRYSSRVVKNKKKGDKLHIDVVPKFYPRRFQSQAELTASHPRDPTSVIWGPSEGINIIMSADGVRPLRVDTGIANSNDVQEDDFDSAPNGRHLISKADMMRANRSYPVGLPYGSRIPLGYRNTRGQAYDTEIMPIVDSIPVGTRPSLVDDLEGIHPMTTMMTPRGNTAIYPLPKRILSRSRKTKSAERAKKSKSVKRRKYNSL